jgi:hypothetical protein
VPVHVEVEPVRDHERGPGHDRPHGGDRSAEQTVVTSATVSC